MSSKNGDKFHPENYEAWSAEELAHYLKTKCGLGNYEEVVKQHDITGKIAPRLEESDLKEMGIKSIGDRKRFQEAIETLQKSARKKEREKTNHPSRCGPIRCCCGHEFEVDNVDLTYISDADFKSESAPCFHHVVCCGKGRDTITISTSSGQKVLHLPKGEGQSVTRKIMNQVEEAQRIERD